MPELTGENDLQIDATQAWAVLADFGGFLNWAGGGQTGGIIKLEGDGIGMIRHMELPGLGDISEELEVCDETTMTLGYKLVAGQPLGMARYSARVRVLPTGEHACRLSWQGTFDGAEDLDENEIADNLKGSWDGMSTALEGYVRG